MNKIKREFLPFMKVQIQKKTKYLNNQSHLMILFGESSNTTIHTVEISDNERIFSQTKLIKNKLRNRMNLDTLNSHLMILLNGPEIEDFNFEEAYKYWENKKNRRINL